MENSKSNRSNTGYRNIFFIKSRGTFESRIINKIYNIDIFIGRFETLKEAIKAREDFIKSLF